MSQEIDKLNYLYIYFFFTFIHALFIMFFRQLIGTVIFLFFKMDSYVLETKDNISGGGAFPLANINKI